MWKWIIVAAILLVLLFAVGITFWVQAEAPFERETLVRTGRAKVLILYHPSRDANFADDLTESLSRGFAEDGLAVERWTITSKTPRRPEGFALIAIVSNTFFGAPDWPTQRYLDSAQLGGQDVIALIGGSGNTDRAEATLGKAISRTGARLILIRSLWTSRLNRGELNRGNHRQGAMQIARRTARDTGRAILDTHSVEESANAEKTQDLTKNRSRT